MVSFIVFIICISIVDSDIFFSLMASLIQFVLKLILATFLPEQKQSENEIEQEKKEDSSQHSTAQAHTRENYISNTDKTTFDVKSTVVREQPKSNKNYNNKKTYQASINHNPKVELSSDKSSFNTEDKYSSTNSFQTQTYVSSNRQVNTESHLSTERSQIYYSGYSEVRLELGRLILSPSQTTIKSGETIQFKLAGLDKFNNKIKISDRISWSVTAGKIDSTGLFSIESQNNVVVTVTAKVSAIKVTSTVNVESICKLIEICQLKTLKVEPDCICLKPEEEQVFKALGFDQYNHPIDCGEIIWSATGGTIDRDGKLVVRNYAKGIYQVTATSKHTAKHGTAAKATLLTLGVSTRILSWAIANEEFFYDVLAPLLNLTNDDDSLSETDALVQGWIIEIGRRRIAKLLKKASNLSFKEAFSNLSDSIDYIVLPELRKIQFRLAPSTIKQSDRIQLKVVGLDQAGDHINVDNQIIWTATSGTIDSQGIFIANEATDNVEITARVKGKNIEAKIEIDIKPSLKKDYVEITGNRLAIYSPRFLIQAGQTKKFQIITGFDSQGNPIEYQGEPIIWETTAGIINSEGLLITPVTNEDLYIEVSAKVSMSELIYSFHTTGLHEYISSYTSEKLLSIAEDMTNLVDELTCLLSEMPKLEQEINELETSMKLYN